MTESGLSALSPRSMTERRIAKILLAAYAAAVLVASHLPVGTGEMPFPLYDKCLHVGEYAVFAVLAWLAFGRRFGVAFAITVLYAGTDELHQLFIVSRTASALDLLADVIGAALSLTVVETGRRLWRFCTRRILDPDSSKVET